MAILTKQEVAEATGQTTRSLSVYIKRKKLPVINKGANKGMVDTKDRAWVEFISMYGWKGKDGNTVAAKPTPQLKHQPQPQEPEDDTDFTDFGIDEDVETDHDTTGGKLMELPKSDKMYKHFLAVKTQRAAELDKIKIEKLKGIVIPSAFIQPVFLQHNQYILTEQKNADEEMLTAMKQKYDITGEDLAWIRGEWTKRRNQAVNKAVDSSLKSVDTIISNFSEKRGVGERT